jgi:hypothetical protein
MMSDSAPEANATEASAFPELRTVAATRYVTPFREGGSVPGLMEAEDDGMYVVKYRGAAQGPKALNAELLGGEIGRALGLPVPELVFIDLDAVLANAEPDPEIQELIKASGGLNLGLDFLPGSLAFVPSVAPPLAPTLAADVVWFDSYIMNVDRTPRNPNLLLWHRKLWLIDHGASLYPTHAWREMDVRARSAFPQVADHILLPFAGSIREASDRLRERLTPEILTAIVETIPEAWLDPHEPFESPREMRKAYLDFLVRRLDAAPIFAEEAERARTRGL